MQMAMAYSLRLRGSQAKGGREETSSYPEARVLTSGNLSTGAVTAEETLGGCWNRLRRCHYLRSLRRYELVLCSIIALR
jgi:hypothetical protein